VEHKPLDQKRDPDLVAAEAAIELAAANAR